MRKLLGIAATAVTALSLAATATAATPTATEFHTGLDDGDAPHGITAGPDGNVWFVNQAGDEVGRITPDGTISTFNLSSGVEAWNIVAGSDGNLWLTELAAGKIAKVTTAGAVSEFTIPTPGSVPKGITAGPGGSLWFVESATNKVGVITTGGSFTEYALPVGANPTDIAFADGNFYVTEPGINQIARVTPAGVVTPSFASGGLSPGAKPGAITTGPDGYLWFTDELSGRIGRMSTGGSVTEFTPPVGSLPRDIVAGQDGNLWFTDYIGNNIGRINPIGSDGTIQASIALFNAGLSSDSNLGGITAGADGNLWFSQLETDSIGRINTELDQPNFQNTSPIDINGGVANQGANPYPSTIDVSGLDGDIYGLSLRLTGLSHTYPDDIDALLTSPEGKTLRVMSDDGGGGGTPADQIGSAVNGVTLNIQNDSSILTVPDKGPLVSGRYNPGFGTGTTSFPAPAPAPPYINGPPYFGEFFGDNANGTWKLWINDDAGGDTGKIHGGWGLSIATFPFGHDDSFVLDEDSGSADLAVIDNDNGTPLEIADVGDPAHGSASVVEGTPDEISYEPDADYCNEPRPAPPDSFDYTLTFGATATVTITVNCVDDPSTANDDSATVAEDSGATNLDVTANDADADGEQTQITGVADAVHGTTSVVQGTPDMVSYAPDANYCNEAGAPDTFTYTVDGGDTATVSMAVTCAAEPVPQTTITKAPKKLKAKSRKKPAKATFEFSSSLAGSSFECSLDGAAPKPCSSPVSLRVKKGKHTFTVAAIAGGEKDPTAATATFKVKAKKRKRK